MKHEVEV